MGLYLVLSGTGVFDSVQRCCLSIIMIVSDMDRYLLLARQVFACSVSSKNAPKRLMKFVRKVSGESFPIAWPNGWYFTFCSLVRQDFFGHLNIKELGKKYLCCDQYLLPVGTVSDNYSLAKVRCVLVILVGEGGRVFVHDPCHDSVYLISRVGFHALLSDGLSNYAPLRERIGPLRYSIGESLAFIFQQDHQNLLELSRVCQKHAGREFAWVCNEELMSALVVSTPAYENPAHQDWIKSTGSSNVLQVFSLLTQWKQKWLEIIVFVNDQLRVFGVNPETKCTEYLAFNLPAFFRVGVLRLGNQQQYWRDCFSSKKGRDVAPAYRPTGCPKELFCRKLVHKKNNQCEKKGRVRGSFLCLGSKHVSDE
ncbi:tegument protein UL43 [Mandrillus leucophaeus cytomegalovirus]|uniref:Tegument protein UL43 n=1 Tax=Mandrillus leucophaeus cytomegalovirus TaxID=1654930 RepID=A0A0G2UPF6_9BETA|nr:tegument protein UL43 [Mandrillus leucophaeus cytomegalovirus]AKI29786.1 tegument protein UL43 [Mandrillus leucophaeus cytomegalovirus]